MNRDLSTSKAISFEKDGEYLDFHVRKQGCLSCAKKKLISENVGGFSWLDIPQRRTQAKTLSLFGSKFNLLLKHKQSLKTHWKCNSCCCNHWFSANIPNILRLTLEGFKPNVFMLPTVIVWNHVVPSFKDVPPISRCGQGWVQLVGELL